MGSGYDFRSDGEISKKCEEGLKSILGYQLWVGSKQPSRSPRTSCRCRLRRPRGPAGSPARRAWRTGHRCRTCSAESEKTWTGCCIYHEAAISCPRRTKMVLMWDVLSEFRVSMFISDRRCLSAISYLVNWLYIPAVAISITTTSAFPHRRNLHHR